VPQLLLVYRPEVMLGLACDICKKAEASADSQLVSWLIEVAAVADRKLLLL